MSSQPPVRVPLTGPGGVIAVIPHILGFHPDHSLVLLGLAGPAHRITIAFRYNLPDPPDPDLADAIADHAAAVLGREAITTAIAVGYGPGTLVTPVTDTLRRVLPDTGIGLHDLLRVEDGRYWSYLCTSTACCPPGGTPVTAAHPAAVAMAVAGLPAAASRAALAATIAPVEGAAAAAMSQATGHAQNAAVLALASLGPDALRTVHLDLVRAVITAYRTGDTITDPGHLARLAIALADIEIRDDAWARMLPGHADAHLRLWADLTRHARYGYVAAPASLLAFVAWQSGHGPLANLALDRALADDPKYSMAGLLREALGAGIPPAAAVLTMTPEEVAASYDAHRQSN